MRSTWLIGLGLAGGFTAFGCGNSSGGGVGGGGVADSGLPDTLTVAADSATTDSALAADTGSLMSSDSGAADTGMSADTGSVDAPAGMEGGADAAPPGHAIKTVFLIMMENTNWSTVTGDSAATYINGTLVPTYGHANAYKNPPGIHPSLPNYLWLEAGTNFNVTVDADPGPTNTQSTTAHLTTQLTTAGVPWKAYAESITAGTCPLVSSGLFVPRHVPMLYFDDITDNSSGSAPVCLAHVVPYANLAADLTGNSVARYNFITPNLCDDMHNIGGSCASFDSTANGDAWLKANVPAILASTAYQDGGVIFILWDEGTLSLSDRPIGLIVLSPLLKSAGYSNTIAYTHSSTLKTIEEIFSVPLLGDAQTATTSDLSDFFTSFP